MQRSCEEKVFGEIRLARTGSLLPQARTPDMVRCECPLCGKRVELPRNQGPEKRVCAACGVSFTRPPCPESEPRPAQGELERWLAGEPIQPRVLSARHRLWRWCLQRPYLVGSTLATLLVLAAVSMFSTWAWHNARLQLHEASQQFQQEHGDRPF